MVQLVSFTFGPNNETLANRLRIEGAIKTMPWARIGPYVWLVSVSANAATVRDQLWQYMSEGDRLFVARLHGEWGAYNLPADVVSWLNEANYV